MKIKTEYVLPAKPEEVYGYFLNADNMSEAWPPEMRMRIISREGNLFTVKFNYLGQQYTATFKIEELGGLRQYHETLDFPFGALRHWITVEPHDSGSKLTEVMELRSPNPLAGPIFRRILRYREQAIKHHFGAAPKPVFKDPLKIGLVAGDSRQHPAHNTRLRAAIHPPATIPRRQIHPRTHLMGPSLVLHTRPRTPLRRHARRHTVQQLLHRPQQHSQARHNPQTPQNTTGSARHQNRQGEKQGNATRLRSHVRRRPHRIHALPTNRPTNHPSTKSIKPSRTHTAGRLARKHRLHILLQPQSRMPGKSSQSLTENNNTAIVCFR
jgi:hypothetical protein